MSDAPAHKPTAPSRRRDDARREGHRRLAFVVAVLVLVGSLGLAAVVGRDDGVGSRASAAILDLAASADALVVAHYGTPGDADGGLLRGGPAEAAGRVAARANQLQAELDRPVVPALHLAAVRAVSEPGADDLYRVRESHQVIRRHLEAARAEGALLVLDVRPGRARWIDEVRSLEPFLREPDVGLALDPEWKVGPDGVPGREIGSIGAGAVNQLTAYLGALVVDEELPDKQVVLHQFTPDMIPGRQAIVARAGIDLIIDISGQGAVTPKVAAYEALTADPGEWRWGIKLFPDQEPEPLAPAQLSGLRPAPALVIYQ
jgi:hypothetical protein